MSEQKLPKKVKIVEVGPRDGLQNEKQVLETEIKKVFIEKLVAAGLREIEATSFVRPDKIPQMKDAKELIQSLSSIKGAVLPCLVPNLKGLDIALELGVSHIAVFTATSDTFNQNNINATVEESLKRIEPVMKKAKENNIEIRGYVSTAFGCPYEGQTRFDILEKNTKWLLDQGAYEVSLGDTIGCANPLQVKTILGKLRKSIDLEKIALHFHDTRAMAISNVMAGLESGVHIFDSSAGGLGGCPYAKGASGNVATEDLVYALNSVGIDCGVDLGKLVEASDYIYSKLNRESQSKVALAYKNSDERLSGPFKG